MDVLVTYDIETADRQGARRLSAVAKVCESYGLRAQKSVFECRLNEVLLARLIAEISQIIEPAQDSVHLYHLRGPCEESRLTLGAVRHRELGQPWLL